MLMGSLGLAKDRKPNQTVNFGKTMSVESKVYITQIGSGHVMTMNGDVAQKIFSGLEAKLETPTRKCESGNQTIDVTVQVKTGVGFHCEVWPKECWGSETYLCTSNIDLKKGSIQAR